MDDVGGAADSNAATPSGPLPVPLDDPPVLAAEEPEEMPADEYLPEAPAGGHLRRFAEARSCIG